MEEGDQGAERRTVGWDSNTTVASSAALDVVMSRLARSAHPTRVVAWVGTTGTHPRTKGAQHSPVGPARITADPKGLLTAPSRVASGGPSDWRNTKDQQADWRR
jgi:hypothetical protein